MMNKSTRLLFVSGEVAPFTEITSIAGLARQLPEALSENDSYESRIMMPRYGTISERQNDLHEVIRLSGTKVAMNDHEEELNVKVASIPGIRLQVYFMDNETYFGRKAEYFEQDQEMFEDNPVRALFFARSVLETACKLGWDADIVHTFGWVSSLVPLVLRTEFDDKELFSTSQVIHTPDIYEPDVRFRDDQVEQLNLSTVPDIATGSFAEFAQQYADGIVRSPDQDAQPDDTLQLAEETNEQAEQVMNLYEDMLNTEQVA